MAEAQTPEQQLDALTKQVADLNKKSEQKDRTIEQLKGKLDAQGKDLAEAQSAAGEKATRIRELEQEAEANEQTIQGYQQQLRAAEAGGDGSTVVSHDDKFYRVVVPQFHFEGKLVKADELKADATLVAKLVTAGSGVLELVEG